LAKLTKCISELYHDVTRLKRESIQKSDKKEFLQVKKVSSWKKRKIF